MESFQPGEGRRASDIAGKALPPEVFKRLPKPERDKVIHETAEEVLSALRSTGAIEYKNITEMYRALAGEELIVRRESPDRIVELVTDKRSLHITFPEGQRYSNAVLWRSDQGSRGLENAFLEGYTHINGVVTVAGFKKGSLDIVSLPDATKHFANIDRTLVRSVLGDVEPKDVFFVSVRTPIFAFPHSDMTEDEQDLLFEYEDAKENGHAPKPAFIYRGFLFVNNIEKH